MSAGRRRCRGRRRRRRRERGDHAVEANAKAEGGLSLSLCEALAYSQCLWVLKPCSKRASEGQNAAESREPREKHDRVSSRIFMHVTHSSLAYVGVYTVAKCLLPQLTIVQTHAAKSLNGSATA